MKCPNLNDKRTKRAMNSIVSALGGAQLTEVEFISRTSQGLREGVDASSIQKMYEVYDAVPSQYTDGFINNVLLLDSVDDANKGADGVNKTFLLARYIDSVVSDNDNPDLYAEDYVKYKFSIGSTIVNGRHYFFNSPKENPDLIDGSFGHSYSDITIGEYLGATTATEVSNAIGLGGNGRPMLDIAPDAKLTDVVDYIQNKIWEQ